MTQTPFSRPSPRTEMLELRLSEQEEDELRAACDGQPLSEWAREILLATARGDLPNGASRELDPVLAWLRAIYNHLAAHTEFPDERRRLIGLERGARMTERLAARIADAGTADDA